MITENPEYLIKPDRFMSNIKCCFLIHAGLILLMLIIKEIPKQSETHCLHQKKQNIAESVNIAKISKQSVWVNT